MKNNILLLWLFGMFFCSIYSCKKDSVNNPGYILRGKIKTLIQYDADTSGSTVSRYNYYYDTISGLLKKVEIQYRYLGEYYTTNIVVINHIDNNTIVYDNFEERRHKEKYRILLDGKQITGIHSVDTLTGDENIVTSVHFNNNTIDSIMDSGTFYAIAGDINLYDLLYNNSNCTKFQSTWSDYMSGNINFNQEECVLTYNSLKNTNMVQFQTIGEYNATVMGFIGYLLGIDGYYLLKPNYNLIDSINRTYPSGYTIKYDYTFSQNNITRIQISYPPRSSEFNRYNDMTYY